MSPAPRADRSSAPAPSAGRCSAAAPPASLPSVDARRPTSSRPGDARAKRLLGLSASPRPRGVTETLVRVALAEARELGARSGTRVEAEIVRLGDLVIGFCDGCLACIYQGKCPKDDDVSWLFDMVTRYDGLVIGTPVFALGVPAQVRTLIDRGVALFPRFLERPAPPVGTIGVGLDPERAGVVAPSVNELALLLGGRLVACRTVAAGRRQARGEAERMVRGGEPSAAPAALSAAREVGKAVFAGVPLEAPAGACPACHLPGPMRPSSGPCPFCLHDPAQPSAKPRFTPEHLSLHLSEWMLPSRARYLEHREMVRKERDALRQDRPTRLLPPTRRD